jgi:hypothetical protein
MLRLGGIRSNQQVSLPRSEVERVVAFNEAMNKGGQEQAGASRWYELVTGGEWPQFILIEDRPNWASFSKQKHIKFDDEERVRKAARRAGSGSPFVPSTPRHVDTIPI